MDAEAIKQSLEGTQLNAQIGCFVAPGAWNLLVVSPNAGSAPSAGVSITIKHSGSCN